MAREPEWRAKQRAEEEARLAAQEAARRWLSGYGIDPKALREVLMSA
jgi:hypothetical protein